MEKELELLREVEKSHAILIPDSRYDTQSHLQETADQIPHLVFEEGR
jgi:hypothetical protein